MKYNESMGLIQVLNSLTNKVILSDNENETAEKYQAEFALTEGTEMKVLAHEMFEIDPVNAAELGYQLNKAIAKWAGRDKTQNDK